MGPKRRQHSPLVVDLMWRSTERQRAPRLSIEPGAEIEQSSRRGGKGFGTKLRQLGWPLHQTLHFIADFESERELKRPGGRTRETLRPSALDHEWGTQAMVQIDHGPRTIMLSCSLDARLNMVDGWTDLHGGRKG